MVTRTRLNVSFIRILPFLLKPLQSCILKQVITPPPPPPPPPTTTTITTTTNNNNNNFNDTLEAFLENVFVGHVQLLVTQQKT